MSKIANTIYDHFPNLKGKHLVVNRFMELLEQINVITEQLNTCSEDRRIVIDVVIEPKNKIE